MINARNIFLLVVFIGSLIATVNYCSRKVRYKPVKDHTKNRRQLSKTDSIQSIIDTQLRVQLEMQRKAFQDTLQEARENYKVIVKKDIRIEYRYFKAPSLPLCDSVIGSKNNRIANLEEINQQYTRIDLLNDSIIGSLQGSITKKNEAITNLNEGYQEATMQLEKALKPRRIGLGLQMGYGAGPTVKIGPYLGFGLNYSIIRL